MSREAGLDLLLSDRFTKVATLDLRTARIAMEKLHGPFQARPATRQVEGTVDIRAARCGQVAVGSFAFGRTVDIVPNALAGAIVVTTATRGRAAIDIGGRTFAMDVGETVIAHEEDDPVFRYQPDTEVLKLRFQRSKLEDFFARSSGARMAPRHRLRFETALSDPDSAARWTALLRFLVMTMNASVRRAQSTLEVAALEDMLMLTLLESQPHNYASAPTQLPADGVPDTFRRAAGYIEQNLAGQITLAAISAAAGCSPRTLARAFKDAGEVPPMQYVHTLRLARIRGELSTLAARDKTVAAIAFEWGYRHLGEFNRQYRAAFGETPSQTRDAAFLAWS
jgi:AraC-like DNA-binding protein